MYSASAKPEMLRESHNVLKDCSLQFPSIPEHHSCDGAENQDSGAGWKGHQAADCERTLLHCWLDVVIEIIWLPYPTKRGDYRLSLARVPSF